MSAPSGDRPDTPLALGYRWPAEWEEHTATWIAWPHNVKTWPGNFDPIPPIFAHIIRTLAQFETVHVLAGGAAIMRQAEAELGGTANVTLVDIPTNDVWVRDYGPTFLCRHDGRLAAVDWEFNSWGGKYPPWDQDRAAAAAIAQQLGVRRFAPETVLEGGSIDGNGQGAILTTETCLLDPHRNSRPSRPRTEETLSQYCAATDVIWIPGGPMAGDDTDGHIDQLARFVSEDRIVIAVEDDASDENYRPLQANLHQLRIENQRRGEPWDLVPLAMPRPIYYQQHRLPASYCNFYIANGCVLAPQFDDPADDAVHRLLQDLFPNREVIGIPCRDLVWGLGALHCMTQQQPAPPGQASHTTR